QRLRRGPLLPQLQRKRSQNRQSESLQGSPGQSLGRSSVPKQSQTVPAPAGRRACQTRYRRSPSSALPDSDPPAPSAEDLLRVLLHNPSSTRKLRARADRSRPAKGGTAVEYAKAAQR